MKDAAEAGADFPAESNAIFLEFVAAHINSGPCEVSSNYIAAESNSSDILAQALIVRTRWFRVDDDTAKIWDLHAESCHCKLIHHDAKIWTATFSTDGRTLLTGGQDQRIRIWGFSR